jgi:hypothetical protein
VLPKEDFSTFGDNILKFDSFAFKIMSKEVIIYLDKPQDFDALMNALECCKDSRVRLGFVVFKSNLNFRSNVSVYELQDEVSYSD